MKIAMRLPDAVHFRCLNARGTLFTVQKALPLFNVFVDITNRLVWYGVDGSGPGARGHLGGPRQCLRVDILPDVRQFAISYGNGEDPMVLERLVSVRGNHLLQEGI
jgi:hypothetical protein